jgi:YidC/Oxa1 family membrane protein insertase
VDKRTFIVLFIVFALFLILQTFVFKPQPNPAPATQTEQPIKQQTPAPADSSAKQTKTTIAAPADSLLKAAATQDTITLSNALMTVNFSNKGANITSVKLAKHHWAKSKEPVDLIPKGQDIAGITLLGLTATPDLKNKLWSHTPADSGKVVFWLDYNGKQAITKTYSLDDKYGIKLDVSVQNYQAISGIEYDFSAGIADTEKIKQKNKGIDYKLLLFAENNLDKVALAKLQKGNIGGDFNAFKWIATRTKYFTIAVCETGNQLTRSYTGMKALDTGNPAFTISSQNRNSSLSWEQSFLIYAGPADYDVMRTYEKTKLELVPERGPGWLRWLSNAIGWLLKFLHSFIPNYGIVIIIFSIILKIILHPLTHKSMDASLKMQRIQPQVQELQAKYKTDPKTLQVELSKLYKEAGASPLSGCLPLLLQMPIFIALYSVLRYTIDMRNASFVGWLSDLSEPDPYMILPIIMAGFMILQSLMMRPPQAAIDKMDEKQKAMQQSTKMMTWMMPIMMFFIFRSLPSGLVLYYTVFNILSVAQQYYLQRHFRQQGN